MTDTRKAAPAWRKNIPSQVRMVVEVDGNPVGLLSLDIDRLWPLISHRKRDSVSVEWIDVQEFGGLTRASVVKRLTARIQSDLSQALGKEMIKAALDVETFMLKTQSAAQAFGRKKTDIQKLVAGSDRTPADFYAFFWDYLLDEREVVDLKKKWKTAAKKR